MMTFWRFPLCGRGCFGKRRFVFGIVVASLPFIAYLWVVLTSSEKRVSNNSHSTNTLPVCPCATRKPAEHFAEKPAIALKVETFTDARKVNHDSSTSYGRLTVHVWSDICGSEVDNLRNWPHFPYFPDKTYSLPAFYKIQVGQLASKGERIFGYVHPRRSGKYKFAITSDGTSELWLSANEDPASSEIIARVHSPNESASNEEENYKKYRDQVSKEITLLAGKKYYIESLSKQGSGVYHVAVYWSYSSSNSPFEIISSEYLSNFSENYRDGAIPLHGGKQPTILLQSKRKQYYFNSLPFIDRKEYIDLIPSCRYIPSFLVRKRLQKNEGVRLTRASQVFPEDETAMYRRTLNHEWSTPNLFVDASRIESVVNKFMANLQPR